MYFQKNLVLKNFHRHFLYLLWCHFIYIGDMVWYLYQWDGIYIGTLVFILVPWYLYWCQGLSIGPMVFMPCYLLQCHDITLVLFYLYQCHGLYIGAIKLILVAWYLYFIGAMVFILRQWYIQWCHGTYFCAIVFRRPG